jgi:hypothetical protein
MNLGGSLRSELSRSGIVFAGRHRTGVRYGSPFAFDAGGRPLAVTLALGRRSLALHVHDQGARYPLRIDPLIQQGTKLTGSGEAGAGGFGIVSLSADGNTALIGGPGDDGGVGAAWVFVRSGGTWIQQGPKLTGVGETGAGRFGNGVALSGDGSTALVAAPVDGFQGAVFVFTRSGGVWSQQGPKLATGTCSGSLCANHSYWFGSAVALSGDGNTALIGGVVSDSEPAAWVYTRSGGAWTQQGPPLTGPGGSTSYFGTPVALSADGSTALLGGPGTTRSHGIITYGNVGSAWVYARTGGGWSEQSELIAGNQSDAMNFGASVAISSDGNTALIGAPAANNNAGTVFAFVRSGDNWSEQGPALTGSGASGQSNFGAPVALSGDGTTALVGGLGGGGQGALWEFVRSGGAWVEQGPKLSGLGWVGALPTIGSSALVGNPSDGNGVGAAWPLVPGHTLSVTLAGSGQGSVTATGLRCAPTCAQTYPDGTMLSLGATASPGSTFAGWLGGGCSGTGLCTIDVTADTTVTATFSAELPVLSGLRITPRHFTISGRLVKRRCVAVGRTNPRLRPCHRAVLMQISYRLSIIARVRFTLTQRLFGRLVNGHCVALSRTNGKRRRCTRLVPVRGSLIQNGHVGPNAFTFTGRIGTARVGPGSYQLAATPSASGHNGTPQIAALTITR